MDGAVGFQVPEGARHPEAQKFKRFLKRHRMECDYDDVPLFSIKVPSDGIYEKVRARLGKVSAEADMIWEDGDPQPERNLDATETAARLLSLDFS